jgi:putative spermidine/putrescine transport system ATP-binding protein
MTGTPVLELRGLCKRYGAHRAVDGLDLELRPHEFMSFLGPSGSGKTTTLMMVAGLQAPDAGSIRIGGKPMDGVPPYRRDIGMVFQNYALFPHMTVAANLAFPLELRGIARREIARQVAVALDLVGLPGLELRLPRQLSGGQQQRVALARALIYRPSLLLMDEPLGALDRKLRIELQGEIKRVHRERRTSVLYVTHDQEEALTMSDRIAVFDRGRLEQVGTPDAVYERPATRFVAAFVGATNFFAGRADGNGRVMAGDTELPCRSVPAAAPGAPIDVAVRPERIELAQPGSAGLPGRLMDVVYLGSAGRAVVRLADGQDATALLRAHQLGTGGFEPGAPVVLAWQAEHGTAFGPAAGGHG